MSNVMSDLMQAVAADPAQSLMIGGAGLGFAWLSLRSGSTSRGRLATSRFGGARELGAARTTALGQMAARKRNAVSIYLGRPKKRGDPSTLYLPDAQRGIAVMGGPGSGKTFSIIDPAIRSVIDQGFPMILYDFKYPTQTSRVVHYARQAGYQVSIFAPGFPESQVCNPLDFVANSCDAENAAQLAAVLNKNFALASGEKGDAFFEKSGNQLVVAVFLTAKLVPELLTPGRLRQILQMNISLLEERLQTGQAAMLPAEEVKFLKKLASQKDAYLSRYIETLADIMTCQSILSLSKLPFRMQVAPLSKWVEKAWSQLISTRDSEKTVASIVTTASIMFNNFVRQRTLGAFCGASSLPLSLQGRQLLVMGLDRERRDVVGPLVAAILHMIVGRNVVYRRTDPLVVALDELPTLYLPALVQWLNENREDGLACILGFQNMAQLEKAYGKELSRSILGGCATKAIFNPQDYESARVFSDYLGDEEVRYKSKSRSTGKGGGSSSLSDQDRTRKLFEPSQFLKLPSGKCVLVSPGFKNSAEASLPVAKAIRIPKADCLAVEAAQGQWEHVLGTLIAESPQRTPMAWEFAVRDWVVGALFPEPLQQARTEASPKDRFGLG